MLAFFAFCLAAVAPDGIVQTLDGRQVAGALVELSTERAVVQTASGQTSIPAGDLSHVAFPDPRDEMPAVPAAWVTLVDGTQLILSEVSLSNRTIRGKSPLDASLAVAQRDVRAVRLHATSDAIDARWNEILQRRATADQIVVRRGERAIDSLEGIFRGITPDDVLFEIDGEVQNVKRSKVFALVLYQAAGRALAKAACTVVDAGGSRLAAAKLQLTGGQLTIVTPAGVSIKRPLGKLRRIDFASARTVFLGDLKPESVEFTPLIGPATDELTQLYQPRSDRALFGGPLQLPRRDGQIYAPAWEYAKGLAIHSRTKLVYRLPREFRTFSATAGIDSRLRPAGNVRLTIHGDERQLYAGTHTGKDEPAALSLDVRGVKRLTVLVDYGEDLDVADHLNLCDARLVE